MYLKILLKESFHKRGQISSDVVFIGSALIVILFFAFFKLTEYPVTWFDEGSHLHVPKTLVQYGVYADRSSEGFRHYGPTVGVGPTVMLPIALVFQVFGIGLLQARLVMVVYLLATIGACYGMVNVLGGKRLAWVVLALLLVSRSVLLIRYGRQVLGEVPGLFFIAAGFWLWFVIWERAKTWHLILVGLLLGLAMVTKYQYLLFLAPTLLIAWLANLVYYRQLPQRMFLIPGIIAAVCVAAWQLFSLVYLGPATISQNLALLRESAAGVAFVFDPKTMEENIRLIVSREVYIGALIPALVYGLTLIVPRNKQGQQWSLIFILAMVNLTWFVFASIGWKRYYFLGIALTAIFVARLLYDLSAGFQFNVRQVWQRLRNNHIVNQQDAVSLSVWVWLIAMILFPVAFTIKDMVITPQLNAPVIMAEYINAHIPKEALIETYEAELGFLTDHNFHYPSPALLAATIVQNELDGPRVRYDFVQMNKPEYVLFGPKGDGAAIYPINYVERNYNLINIVGDYRLYEIK